MYACMYIFSLTNLKLWKHHQAQSQQADRDLVRLAL